MIINSPPQCFPLDPVKRPLVDSETLPNGLYEVDEPREIRDIYDHCRDDLMEGCETRRLFRIDDIQFLPTRFPGIEQARIRADGKRVVVVREKV